MKRSGKRMKNIIVGTAGHIDHGKSALARALTGIETDRLQEEKSRGISIDLGFAHLEVGDVRFGFVDVPGHERFVKNMLAGATGIDIVLLVIAADESIKPQTREHFEICRLLGVRNGIVVLTKADLVDPDILELVKLEVADFVAGSFLEGAPILPVSNKTGAGLDALREALVLAVPGIPARDQSGPFRLPIDRAFSLRGFGAVVTGTLLSGVVRPEDEVELHPGGRLIRVRGLHVHNQPVAEAAAGQRTAVNLASIDTAELRRGQSLATPGLFEATSVLDCRLELLSSAPPLKHRAPVHFHAGTAEVDAEVRLLESLAPVKPGASAFVRLLLKEPLLLLPGDRFIVRMFSPVVTIGGGAVIDNHPPRRIKRSLAAHRLPALESASLEQRAVLLVSEAPDGIAVPHLTARTGAPYASAGDALVRIGGVVIAAASIRAHADRLRDALGAFHKQNPLLAGLPKASAPTPTHLLDAVLTESKDVVSDADVIRLVTHRVALKADEDQALGKIESLFRGAGLAVPAVNEVLSQSGLDANRARNLLQILLRNATLVRVSADLIYHRDAISSLKQILAARRGQSFSVADFKEWTGISRKYAIPLLEFLDRDRTTRRAGDARQIL
jgi:selenocysteine-specific elongation factor